MSTHIIGKDYELTCKPLDTYDEILLFLQDPPSWRTLCKGITPHSKSLIRNSEINKHLSPSLETPETFCHFDPDVEDIQRCNEEKLPKTLVCHDMANGYHDDSIIDGTGNYDVYTFYNWAGIDIFCYFSHHLITIPPLGWINVAHDHGVKVIGTIITEWADGLAFWDKILDSEEKYQNFASALVAIAKTLKFDGWLLNIENKIAKPDDLLEFVRYFHGSLHRELPGAELIWYDSVTVHGDLSWQNGLNEKNRAFFDICDGFFTNYSWTEGHISSSAAAAGDRLTDLYIGIDVWGRNFYGGGQFNTQVAVKVAHSYGCSLAIFAPAWTHEAMTSDKCDKNAVSMADEANKYEQFLLRDRALWGSIWQFLNTKVPCQLPFQTSFCRGQGLKRRLYGEVLCPVPWFNLRHMQYQPNSSHGPHGYLLSPMDKIIYVSEQAIYKDESGIIKYKESFQLSRQDLHSVKSKENDILTKDESLNDLEVESEPEEDDEQPKNIKRKIRSALENVFKLKNQKSEIEDNEADDGPSAVSGQSMVQVSVNLNLENSNKIRYGLSCVPGERECLEIYFGDSFIGGSCLKINPSDEMCHEHRFTRLFHCDFLCKEVIVACVVTKHVPGYVEQYLNVNLFIKNSRDENLRVVLVGRSLPQIHKADQTAKRVIHVYPLNSTSDEDFSDLQKYLLLNKPGFYVPIENSYNWIVRYYVIDAPEFRVTSINLHTGLEQGPILLGYFGLCERLDGGEMK